MRHLALCLAIAVILAPIPAAAKILDRNSPISPQSHKEHEAKTEISISSL